MTLYYDGDKNQIVENHPGDWMYIDDEGRMIIDFNRCPHQDQKLRSLLNAVEKAIRGNDHHVTITGNGLGILEDEFVEY